MIRHLIKLIWNRKGKNFLMITEVFFSFLVLFGVCSIAINYANRYYKPLGFTYENVWLMSANTAPNTSPEEKRERLSQLVNQLNAMPQTEAVALGSSNAPYTGSTSSTSIHLNGKSADANIITIHHDDFMEVMDFKLADGRWFGQQDLGSQFKPVVITQDLQEALFGDESAVGKDLFNGRNRIIGVIESYKANGDFAESMGSYIQNFSLTDTTEGVGSTVFIRVKPGVSQAFEEQIIKTATAYCPNWTFNLRPMADMRESYMMANLVPVVILFIVSLFLILNVALGIFGVLWHNINKRYSEIGLRRAVGATGSQIYKQFLGEMLVLTTFGILFGCFFAMQFPLLGVFDLETEVYVAAISVAMLVIYTLVIVCALYPSRQAAAIHPAMALHEE